MARMARQEEAGRPRDPAELTSPPRVHRPGPLGPRLDLDEGENGAAARHDIDLAQPGLVAAGQDGIAGEPQAPYRAQLGDMPQLLGLLARLRRHAASSRLSASARA